MGPQSEGFQKKTPALLSQRAMTSWAQQPDSFTLPPPLSSQLYGYSLSSAPQSLGKNVVCVWQKMQDRRTMACLPLKSLRNATMWLGLRHRCSAKGKQTSLVLYKHWCLPCTFYDQP